MGDDPMKITNFLGRKGYKHSQWGGGFTTPTDDLGGAKSAATKKKEKADLKKKDKLCKKAKGKFSTCEIDCLHLFVKRPCPICGKGRTAMMEAFPKVDEKKEECKKKATKTKARPAKKPIVAPKKDDPM